MKDNKYAKHILNIARKDLYALKGMINDSNIFDDTIFGFHAQQVVEKSLKAILSLNGIEFYKTHDIFELFNQIKENKIELPDVYLSLTNLTDFAVEYRYDLMLDNDPLNRENIYTEVNSLFCFIEELVMNKEKGN